MLGGRVRNKLFFMVGKVFSSSQSESRAFEAVQIPMRGVFVEMRPIYLCKMKTRTKLLVLRENTICSSCTNSAGT